MLALPVISQPVPTRTTVRRLASKRSRQWGKQLVFTEIAWLALPGTVPSYKVRENAISRQSLT